MKKQYLAKKTFYLFFWHKVTSYLTVTFSIVVFVYFLDTYILTLLCILCKIYITILLEVFKILNTVVYKI